MRNFTKLALVATTMAALLPASAQAAILVNFSFTGMLDGPGIVVKGLLEFEKAGVDVAATRVKVLSSTDPLLDETYSFGLTEDFTLQNAFTVSADGMISAASLVVEGLLSENYRRLSLGSPGNNYGIEFRNGAFAFSQSEAGLSGATYSSAVAAVPEASTWIMMLVGFGLIGATARYRRKGVQVRYA